MEFDSIKSSAALIYDEFIQNAGESRHIQSVIAFGFVSVHEPRWSHDLSTSFSYRLADGAMAPHVVPSPPNAHHRSLHLLRHVVGASDNGEP